MPKRRHIDQIRISGMNANPRNSSRIFESHMLPCFSRIGGFPNTITVGNIPSNGHFATANINDIGIPFTDRYGANGTTKISIGNIIPGLAAIFGLPYATTCCTKVGQHFIPGDARRSGRPPTTKRTDIPVL